MLGILSVWLAGYAQILSGGFEYFGEWSDVSVSKSDDPHASGNVLTLWKDNGEIVGFLNEYVGPVGDAPFGPIQDVKYDANSGQFSFGVKLSRGVINLPGRNELVPTRDFYVFTGIINDQDIRGVLEEQDHIYNVNPVKRDVVWKRTERENSFWTGKTLQEWSDYYAPILKFRGPKW